MTVTDYTSLKPEQILLNDDYEPRQKTLLLHTDDDANSRNITQSGKFIKQRATTTSKKKRTLLITMPGTTRAISNMKLHPQNFTTEPHSVVARNGP
jgi:hypothetical protein